MPTTNESLMNSAIRHAVLVERYANLQAGRVRNIIEGVIPELTSAIAQIEGFGLSPTAQRKALKIVNDLYGATMDDASSYLEPQLVDLAQAESAYQVKKFDDFIPIDVDLTRPSARTLNALVTSLPIDGKFYNEWFVKLGNDFTNASITQIRKGMTLGESTLELVHRVMGTADANFGDGIFKNQLRHAETFVRTAVNHTSNQARKESMDANPDVVKGYRFVATLDASTSVLCADLDGDFWDLNDPATQVPPIHPNCRSQLAPVVKSFKEMGLPFKEFPEGTRASLDGQVPARTTYPQWLKKQSLETQREVLGKTKAELFSRGLVKMDSFTNDKGIIYSLDTLLKREGILREDVFSLAG